MKKYLVPANLKWAVPAAGFLGLLLRLWVLSSRGQNGLLAANHPAEFLLWLLTAAVVAAVVFFSRNLTEGTKYSFNFPPSYTGAIGCILGALSIGITSIAEWIVYPDTLTLVASLLGLLSAAALPFLALYRMKGQRQSILYHGVICLYFMFRLVSQYRHWSADPQLMNYAFQLLASVCLMLACYQNAAFDVQQGNRRMHTIFHLCAAYFCIVSLISSENIVFYVGTCAWMVTNLCNLTPMRKQEEA